MPDLAAARAELAHGADLQKQIWTQAVAAASSFLAGHAMAAAKYGGRLHMLCFAVVMSAAVYVILDFEFPRMGLMRIDKFDHLLVDLRASMN